MPYKGIPKKISKFNLLLHIHLSIVWGNTCYRCFIAFLPGIFRVILVRKVYSTTPRMELKVLHCIEERACFSVLALISEILVADLSFML